MTAAMHGNGLLVDGTDALVDVGTHERVVVSLFPEPHLPVVDVLLIARRRRAALLQASD